MPLENALQRRAVPDVRSRELERTQALQPFQVLVRVLARKVVDDDHGVPSLQEASDRVRTDETASREVRVIILA
jgi:hypothetical protein